MKKLIRTTLLAVIMAGTLVAFRGPGPRQPNSPAPGTDQVPPNNQTPKKNQQRYRDADTLGRPVDIDSARSCVRLYAALSVKNKLTLREEKLYPNFRRSRVNTTGEVFSGKSLLAWLQSVDSLYDSQKLVMHLDVQLGIYTEEYLKRYHPSDEVMRRKLLGRVAIFMIPTDSVSKWSIDRDGKLSPDREEKLYSKVSLNHGPSAMPPSGLTEGIAAQATFGAGPAGTAYDLGGIKP